MTSDYIVDLRELTAGDVARVGGKNASLGELIRSLRPAGVNVPPGFATTADAYWSFVEVNHLREPIEAAFAARYDGFSIGSNDLTQLVLGVDRDSAELAPLFDERDEAVMRLIRDVVERAHRCGREVGLCGQAPGTTPILLGSWWTLVSTLCRSHRTASSA